MSDFYAHSPLGADHIGHRLRARREVLELSVSDMSKSTNLREDYIIAIERLDAAGLPAIGYVLGFIRTYAKSLGLDANAAVLDYKHDVAIADGLTLRDAPHFVFQRKIRLPRGFVSALTVVALAVMMGAWYGVQTEAVAEPTASPTVLPLAVNTPVAPIMAEGLLTLRTTAPSWVQVSDATGTTLVSRIFVTGEMWQGPVGGGYTVSVRDAGAVELYDGERLIGPLGAKGEPLTDVLLGRE